VIVLKVTAGIAALLNFEPSRIAQGRNYMRYSAPYQVNPLKTKTLGFGTPCATFYTFPSSDRGLLLG
jgi:hypothetical protein